MEVTIYTDGACSKNPGPGGWAAILVSDQREWELSGFVPETTNNRMELQALIEGLQAIDRPSKVCVRSDSAYLINAFQKNWLERWQRNGWRTSTKKPVENQDLWKALLALLEPHQVTFSWVKGHSVDPLNNRCDQMARREIRGLTQRAR